MRPPQDRRPRAQSRSVADLMALMLSQAPQAAEPPRPRLRLPFGLGVRATRVQPSRTPPPPPRPGC